MRLISCAMTIRQIYARLKTETRRLGWLDVKPGDLLQFVDRTMGFKKGEHPNPVAIVVVTAVRREKLSRIKKTACVAEGFPALHPSQFVRMFRKNMNCGPGTEVTVISFKYIPGGRALVECICRKCGCTDGDACFDPSFGTCGWAESDLCTHCVYGLYGRPNFTPEEFAR
jgi:hypothetical protein